MLHPFISSPQSSTRMSARASHTAHLVHGSGLAASVALHATLVALAVVATTSSVTNSVAIPLHVAERIVFTRVAPSVPTGVATVARVAAQLVGRAHAAAAAASVARFELGSRLPEVAAVDLSATLVPIDLPGDLHARATGSLEFATGGLDEWSGRARTLPAPDVDGRAYSEGLVERRVLPYGSNPLPRYPSSLQSAAVEQSFVAAFVVDSTGRIDAQTLEFPRDAHAQFARAVRDALLRSRYLPAQLAGHAVPQLVRQRFSFVMVR